MHDYTQAVSFSFPTNIRFGCGVIKELPAHLKEQGFKRPFLVTDPNVAQLDFFKEIVNELSSAGLSTEVFHDIHKNPVKSDVLKGGDLYESTERDCVIGIGGGAGMDVARAIVLRINHRRDLFDYDDLIGGDKYVTEEVPYFITVPTTSGTGSEVGRSAIISEDETKRKRILFAPKLLARQVFADPELTFGLPAFITAATGMDALTHNMEAFLAKGYHPMCDGLALEAMRMISDSLETAVHKPEDKKARSEMMLASLMGAVAFQKGLGIVHATAHPLSTLLDMHHGLANAMMIPYGMEYNQAGLESKFEQMSKALNTNDVNQFLFDLKDKLQLPSGLKDLGVKEENLEDLTELALNDFCLPANPKNAQAKDIMNIYKKAM